MAGFTDLALETQEQIWKYVLLSPRAYVVELRCVLLKGNILPSMMGGQLGEGGTMNEVDATQEGERYGMAEKMWRSLQVVVPPKSKPNPLAQDPLPTADGLSPSTEPTNVPQVKLISQPSISEFESWRSIVQVCRLSRVIALQELAHSPSVLHKNMSLLTENHSDVLNSCQDLASPPATGQPRSETTKTPLMGEHLYFPVPFHYTDLYIFDWITATPRGFGAYLVPLTWSPHRLVIDPARLRHIGMPYPEAWDTPKSLRLYTVRTKCCWCTHFNQRLLQSENRTHDRYHVTLQPDRIPDLHPSMRECCLSRWVLQRFACMEAFYLVVPGIPHPSTRGSKEPLQVFHSADRLYYEIDRIDPYFRDHMRPIRLLQYLEDTIRSAPSLEGLRGPMFPEVKFKILSWKTAEKSIGVLPS